jgi:HD-GYP domain-containing protein (c-di-GMP phosphodiesterase class II)
MLNKRKKAVLHFFSALQVGKLYLKNHPLYDDSIEKCHKSLQEALENKTELIIGMLDEELACEEEIYFDLSRRLKPSILFLSERNIQKIYFHRALTKDELSQFISLLATFDKDKLKKDSQKILVLHGIRNIKTGKIKEDSLFKIRGTDDWKALKKLYNSSIDTYASSIDSVLNQNKVDYIDLRFNLLNIMENFIGRHQEIMNLIQIKSKDLLTFVHLLNVSILAMHLSSKLGFSKDNVLDVGVAALFHDVGKIYISSQILTKKSKLSEKEFSKIRDHPVFGARILNEYTDTMGALPALVAFEHHIRYDLQGYPKVEYPKQPFIVSFMVSVCDVYDALAQRRTYKKDYPPNKIYEVMIKERGREINERDIFRPKVEVIDPPGKKRFIDLQKDKSNIQIEAALNPFGEGKEFLEFIKR